MGAAPRLNMFVGKSGGFFDNHKTSADLILSTVEEELSTRFALAGSIWRKSTSAASKPEPGIVSEMIEAGTEFAVVALGN